MLPSMPPTTLPNGLDDIAIAIQYLLFLRLIHNVAFLWKRMNSENVNISAIPIFRLQIDIARLHRYIRLIHFCCILVDDDRWYSRSLSWWLKQTLLLRLLIRRLQLSGIWLISQLRDLDIQPIHNEKPAHDMLFFAQLGCHRSSLLSFIIS